MLYRSVTVLLAALSGALLSSTASAQNGAGISPATAKPSPTIRITSPLGRTGNVTRVRIVAQIDIPEGTTLSPVGFFVDGQPIGTVDEGPPYAVDWVDENPFERREILVRAADSFGRTISDTVVLPPFEVQGRAEVTSILLETSVYDRKSGRFVANLEPDAFTVTESGIAQAIDLVARETVPTNVVLLVDNSQSMSRRIDFVRDAAGRLALGLREHDRAIVAPFNATIGTITGPTNDSSTIGEAISAMRAGGGTAILDVLLEAIKLLDGADGRRAVVLITDGYDEHSKSDVEMVLKRAAEAQVTVYVVGIGGVAGISLRGERLLRRITEQTGGRVFFPPREIDLIAVATDVATDTHSRYLITYTPSNQRKDGTWRDVDVKVGEEYTVRTRAGYFAPKPPPIRPTIEFTITDTARDFVDVAVEDLEVLEDGVPQDVDTFQEAVDPVSIVMTLDSSGSMKNAAEAVKASAREFTAQVRAEDSLALITFADKPRFAHVLAKERQWTFDAIDKYVPLGGTALYDALWNSLMHLKDVPGRRAIVVFTDGRDENNPGTAPGSVHVLDEVLELSREVGATIFGVGLGTKVDGEVLEMLAAATGGAAYFAADTTMLSDQFGEVVENLRRRYVLSYTSTNSDHDGEWRKVEIRPREPGLAVATLGGYFAPDDRTAAQTAAGLRK